VVFVEAGLELRRAPALFAQLEGLDGAFFNRRAGAPVRARPEIASGVFFLNYTQAAVDLCVLWAAVADDSANADADDGSALSALLEPPPAAASAPEELGEFAGVGWRAHAYRTLPAGGRHPLRLSWLPLEYLHVVGHGAHDDPVLTDGGSALQLKQRARRRAGQGAPCRLPPVPELARDLMRSPVLGVSSGTVPGHEDAPVINGDGAHGGAAHIMDLRTQEHEL